MRAIITKSRPLSMDQLRQKRSELKEALNSNQNVDVQDALDNECLEVERQRLLQELQCTETAIRNLEKSELRKAATAEFWVQPDIWRLGALVWTFATTTKSDVFNAGICAYPYLCYMAGEVLLFVTTESPSWMVGIYLCLALSSWTLNTKWTTVPIILHRCGCIARTHLYVAQFGAIARVFSGCSGCLVLASLADVARKFFSK